MYAGAYRLGSILPNVVLSCLGGEGHKEWRKHGRMEDMAMARNERVQSRKFVMAETEVSRLSGCVVWILNRRNAYARARASAWAAKC